MTDCSGYRVLAVPCDEVGLYDPLDNLIASDAYFDVQKLVDLVAKHKEGR